MSTPNRHHVKRLSVYGVDFVHTAMVEHRGTLVAFAMDRERRIWYAVLDLDAAALAGQVLDVEGWPDEPRLLPFPGEIMQVGYGAITPTALPLVKPRSLQEPAANEVLDPADADPFYSSTARLTADVGAFEADNPGASCAPFKVFSDGESVFLFRQAVPAAHRSNLHVLAKGGLSGSASRPTTDFALDAAGQKTPVVDSTLLCDRYSVVGDSLQLRREVRFRRSRKRHLPQGVTDTLGPEDMLGQPFIEPTQELAFVKHLEGGSFEVMQLPTENPQRRRWQIFAYDKDTRRIGSFSIPVDEDGLFRMQGEVRYTSPDPRFASAVDEPGPGTCPHTGRALVPVFPSSTLGGCAARFTPARRSHVVLPRFADDAFTGGFTLEVRIRYRSFQTWSRIFDFGDGQGLHNIVLANKAGTSTLGLHLFEPGQVPLAIEKAGVLRLNEWMHVAAKVEVGATHTATLYVNGQVVLPSILPRPPKTLSRKLCYVGRSHWPSDGYLDADVDEIRVWGRALPDAEIQRMHRVRRTGVEPGLLGYWRLDEGRGDAVVDLTGNLPDGQLVSGDWVASGAPLAPNPGLARSSYRLAGLRPDRGLSATLYHLQEESEAGATLKQQARVMLLASCSEEGQGASSPTVTAALDLGVSVEGTLAESQTPLSLPSLDAPDPRVFDDRIALEERQRQLRQALNANTRLRRDRHAITEATGWSAAGVLNVAASSTLALVTVIRWRSSYGGGRTPGPEYCILAYAMDGDGLWAFQQELPQPMVQGVRVSMLGRGLAMSGRYAAATSWGGVLHVYEYVNGSWALACSSSAFEPRDYSWSFDNTVYRLAMSGARIVMTSSGSRNYSGAASFFEYDAASRTLKNTWAVNGTQRRYYRSGEDGPEPIGLAPGAVFVLIGRPDDDAVDLYSWNPGTPPSRALGINAPLGSGRSVRGFGASVSDMTMSGKFFIGDPEFENADGTQGRVLQYVYGSPPTLLATLTGAEKGRPFGRQLAMWQSRLLVGDAPVTGWVEAREPPGDWTLLKRGPCSVYDFREGSTQGYVVHSVHYLTHGRDRGDGLQLAVTEKSLFVTHGEWGRVEFLTVSPDPSVQQELNRVTLELSKSPAELQTLPRYSGEPGHLDTDPNGLTVYGARLDWADAGSDAHLLDSILGTVGLYYQDRQRSLRAAHFEALSARATFTLRGSGSDALRLRARAADERMDKLRIAVAAGASANTCALTISLTEASGATLTETWTGVPRALKELAKVLNGEPDALAAAGGSVSCSDPRYTLTNGSLFVRALVEASAQGAVLDGAATLSRAGRRPRWRANTPGSAYQFNGSSTRVSLDRGRLGALPVPERLCFEAWLKPDTLAADGTLLHAYSKQGVEGERGFSFGLTSGAPRSGALLSPGQILDCGGEINFTKAHTVEAWTRGDVAIQLWSPSLKSYDSLHWSLHGDVTLALRFLDSGDVLTSITGVRQGAWRHWCWVQDPDDNMNTRIYVNGMLVAKGGYGNRPEKDARLRVRDKIEGGAAYRRTPADQPGIYDLRVWDHARSITDIQQGMGHDLTGAEPGLVGYYRFDEGRPIDHSRYQRHGTSIAGGPSLAATPGPEDIKVARFVAGTQHPQGGQRWALASRPLPLHIWTHVACNFRQSAALRFEDGQYADMGKHTSLDRPGEVSLEVVIQPLELGREQVILCKGVQRSGGGQTVPYALLLDGQGYPVFMFEALHADGTTQEFRFRATEKLTQGVPVHLAVVREAGNSVEQRTGPKKVRYKDHTGQVTEVDVQTVEAVNPIEWFDIRIFINGQERGRFQHRDAQPAQSDGALTLASMGGRDMFFRGLICEARIWKKTISLSDPYRTPRPREEGLVAWWRVDEGKGATLSDSAGENTGRVRGGSWVANPDPRARTFSLLINGDPVEMSSVAPTHPLYSAGWGDEQLSLGSRLVSGAPTKVFSGTLEELRLWERTRDQEEVLDELFRRVRAGHPELHLAYSFDEDSTLVSATQLRDQGPMGFDLELGANTERPEVILSTVPIGEDAAQVRSALNGVRSPFFSFSDGRPAAAEYSDLQLGPAKELRGVMKRAYTFTDQGDWCLVTGFKVGELITQYLGQVQFAPQVVGYVEGTPPLPGENMTAGQITEDSTGWQYIANYATVKLEESAKVTYTVSGSSERKVTASLDLEVKKELGNNEQELILAPLGVGYSVEITQSTPASLTFKGHVDGSRTWTNEASYAASINRSRSLEVSLGGSWEDPASPHNPAIGRRLLMGNTGYALVRSSTADLYALRLRETQTLVSFRMLPDLHVPVDWNIIPFNINPLYTKQGTLDGVVGFDASGQPVADPDYPNATGQAGLSYFKPQEAYDIKRRIEREEMEMAAYLTGQSAPSPLNDGVIGGALGTLAGVAMQQDTGGGLERAMGELQQRYGQRQLVGRYAKRNLCNTYVWTADGGFFAETEEKTDVRSETVSGQLEVNGELSLTFATDISVLGFGFELELGASMGAGYTLSRSRASEDEQSFSLAVAVNPPGDLMRYEQVNGAYTPTNGGANLPGKVDAYRFMSFYLDSDTVNFDHLFNQVIDPAWLADPKSANARALREARQARKKPPCWRVFHRVTWVSRVLPELSGAAPSTATLQQRLSHSGIASNWELINLLGPYVRFAGQDEAKVRAALERALEAYPELRPSLDELVEFFLLYAGTVPGEAQGLRIFYQYGFGGGLNTGIMGLPVNTTPEGL